MRFAKYFYESVLEILFPSLCIGCGKNTPSGEAVCADCFSSIPLNDSLFCGKCGARLPACAGRPYGQKICHFDFPFLLGAATTYTNGTARSLIRDLKFGFIGNSAAPLAKLLTAYAEKTGIGGKDWIVVPIPLGAKRLRKRGFNQAALIGKIFAGHFGLEICENILSRIKETSPQSEIEKFGMRVKNVADCFEVASPEKAVGKNIIIIDDVSTSGATFFEAASALKKCGARKIIALAAAKG